MLDFEIREVSAHEMAKLQDISIKTFVETFAEQNTAANMRKYLKDNLSITKLTEEVLDPQSEFYFALFDHEVIGYLKVNYGTTPTEWHAHPSIEIERIYVLKSYHGKGVGQGLLKKAMQIAHHFSAKHLWLGVWERNSKAIYFYKRNGFEEFGSHLFKLGDDIQTDILMRLNVKDDLPVV